jgi:hypothetical protein
VLKDKIPKSKVLALLVVAIVAEIGTEVNFKRNEKPKKKKKKKKKKRELSIIVLLFFLF